MGVERNIRIVIITLMVAMAGIGVANASSNLVTNGGFEEPVVSGDWALFASIPGWTEMSASQLELQRSVSTWLPYEGNQYMEMDAMGSTTIYQDIATVPGMTYKLSFAFSPRPGVDDNVLQISWNGIVKDTLSESSSDSANTAWTVHMYDLTATQTPTRLEFKNLDASDRLGTFLDAVILTKTDTTNGATNDTNIPEFPTVALPILAVIGLMFMFQRRKGK